MSDDLLSEMQLIDFSMAQREAWLNRWPLILLTAGETELAEEIRAELSAQDERKLAA